MPIQNIISTELLTATVFASIISSLISIIIAIINNIHVKKIERTKYQVEISKYRYTRLYELILNWNNYSTKVDFEDKSPGEIADIRLMNGFLDNLGRYNIARPLLDRDYLQRLEEMQSECNELLIQLIRKENSSGLNTRDYYIIKDAYLNSSSIYEETLKDTINEQLDKLFLSIK